MLSVSFELEPGIGLVLTEYLTIPYNDEWSQESERGRIFMWSSTA